MFSFLTLDYKFSNYKGQGLYYIDNYKMALGSSPGYTNTHKMNLSIYLLEVMYLKLLFSFSDPARNSRKFEWLKKIRQSLHTPLTFYE